MHAVLQSIALVCSFIEYVVLECSKIWLAQVQYRGAHINNLGLSVLSNLVLLALFILRLLKYSGL